MTLFDRIVIFLKCLDTLYPENEILTCVIKQCLSGTITSVEFVEEGYYLVATFDNGISIRGWNRDQFFAWFFHGKITEDNEIIYQWSGSMPSRMCMYYLNVKIQEFLLSRCNLSEKSAPSISLFWRVFNFLF